MKLECNKILRPRAAHAEALHLVSRELMKIFAYFRYYKAEFFVAFDHFSFPFCLIAMPLCAADVDNSTLLLYYFDYFLSIDFSKYKPVAPRDRGKGV
jgi:hypothetical protein